MRNIGVLKSRQNLPIQNPDVEYNKLQSMRKMGLLDGLDPYAVERIMQEIMKQSKRIQQLQREKVMIIGHLGSLGSHSSVAAMKYDTPMRSYDTFEDLIIAVRDGNISHALVPVLNSITGVISETTNLILEHNLQVVESIDQKIEHNLATRGNKEIKYLYSHPQVLKQCSTYLGEEYELIAARSTPEAVQKMLLDTRENVGVICSPLSSNLHSLKVLVENISNELNNYTRFYLVTSQNYWRDEL